VLVGATAQALRSAVRRSTGSAPGSRPRHAVEIYLVEISSRREPGVDLSEVVFALVLALPLRLALRQGEGAVRAAGAGLVGRRGVGGFLAALLAGYEVFAALPLMELPRCSCWSPSPLRHRRADKRQLRKASGFYLNPR